MSMAVSTMYDVDRELLHYVDDIRQLAEDYHHEPSMLELGKLRKLLRDIGSQPWEVLRFAIYAFMVRGR